MYAVRLLKVPFCYWEMRIFHADEQETFSPEEQLIAAALRCEHYFESLPRPKRQHITFGCFKDDILNLRSLFVTERNHYKKSIPFHWKCNYYKPFSHISYVWGNGQPQKCPWIITSFDPYVLRLYWIYMGFGRFVKQQTHILFVEEFCRFPIHCTVTETSSSFAFWKIHAEWLTFVYNIIYGSFVIKHL